MAAQHPFQVLDQLAIGPEASIDLESFIAGRLGLTVPEVRAGVAAKFDAATLATFDKAAAAYDATNFATVEGRGTQPATRVHKSVPAMRSAVALKFGSNSCELAAVEAFVLANPRDVAGLERLAAERFGIDVSTPSAN